MKKKLVSLLLVLCLAFTLLPFGASAVTLTSSQVANYFNGRVGGKYESGYCLRFVKEGFVALGGTESTSCCAYNYGSSHIQSTSSSNIPIGADVFFGNCGGGPCKNCGATYFGHIGVYVGNGEFVHATGGTVQKGSISSSYWGPRYRGWGYHGGVTITDNTPDVKLTKDTRYPTPFVAYPTATSGKITVYDPSLNAYSQSSHYIAYNDQCTVSEVYTNGYCRVTYPSGSGTFTAYAKLDSFIPSGTTPYSYTPGQTVTSYKRSNMQETFGSVSASDKCTVVAQSGSKLQVIYPISSGYKLGWITPPTTPTVLASDFKTPILGYNASASARTTVYEKESTLGGTSYGQIFVDDLCTINAVNLSKNWVNVTYPISSGTKTGYVYLSEFFPAISGISSVYTTKVSQNTTAYRKSDMADTIGTIYPSDTITVVGKSGSKLQVLYPITEGSNAGKYKLGWITTSNVVKNLVSIAVTTKPSKTTYLEGESLNTSGLVVTAKYDDNSTANVTGSCSFSGYSSTPGVKTVNVTYSGKQTAFTVTVNSKSPTSISVISSPNKTTYQIGEKLDVTGLRIRAYYNNNTNAEITDYEVGVGEDGFQTAGTQSVTVEYIYNDVLVSTSFNVTVTDPAVYVDLNGYISGARTANIAGYGTADVYVNNSIVADDCTDFYQKVNKGSSVQIKDVKAAEGYSFTGTQTGSLSFTVGDSDADIQLKFIPETAEVNVSAGLYVLQSALDSTKVVGIAGSGQSSGANAELQTRTSSDAQVFRVQKYDGYYTLTAVHSLQALNVANSSGESGVNVNQASAGSADTQKWRFLDGGSGYVYVKSLLGMFLDVQSENSAAGTNIQTYYSKETDSQRWKLVSVGAAITTQPKNTSGVVGDTVTFTVKASGEGLAYQWQYKDVGGTWKNSTSTTDSAKCAVTAARDGRMYRCTVTDKYGNTVTSSSAKLTVKPAIAEQPKDYTGGVGDTATFTVKATGVSLSYQWQYSDDNGNTWTNSKSTDASATCSITAARDGRLYRCKVTDGNGVIVMSGSAKLNVKTELAITGQPKNVSGVVGDTVTFTVKASGDGLTYQWQYKDAGGSWTNSKSVTATATCAVTAARDGRLYRCKVTDRYGTTVTSSSAKLTVKPAITEQPRDFGGAVGDTATFNVKATGAGLSYQWQYSDDSGKTWTNSKSTDATATCGITAARNGRLYRCVVTDAHGVKVTSSTAKVIVKTALAITTQPKNFTGAVGQTATFTVKATGDGLKYQWQYSDNNGSTWKDSSSTTATATCGITEERDGRVYRCIITDQYGDSVTSSKARVLVG